MRSPGAPLNEWDPSLNAPTSHSLSGQGDLRPGDENKANRWPPKGQDACIYWSYTGQNGDKEDSLMW